MFDKDYLSYVIRNRKYLIEDFIVELGMSKQTFYKKVKEPKRFTYQEMMKIVEILNLNESEILSIFFKNNVA